MKRIWLQFGRHLDILIMAVTSIFIGGMAYANIQSTLAEHARMIEEHKVKIERVETDTQVIRETSARTEQKVDDMAGNITDIKIWLRGMKHNE